MTEVIFDRKFLAGVELRTSKGLTRSNHELVTGIAALGVSVAITVPGWQRYEKSSLGLLKQEMSEGMARRLIQLCSRQFVAAIMTMIAIRLRVI